eukprot:COSAG01_NODE_2448_length_7682_cov_10.409600_13_plen_151_part_00
MQVCRYVYDPTERTKFVVSFETDYQVLRAERVIAHLRTLSNDDLHEEAIQFFKWLILHHVADFKYAEALLAFFHSQNLLLHKSAIHNPQKQRMKRYLVIFTMKSPVREHVFSKTYNSIRELKADTGKKPSQIICQPSANLFCEILNENKI